MPNLERPCTPKAALTAIRQIPYVGYLMERRSGGAEGRRGGGAEEQRNRGALTLPQKLGNSCLYGCYSNAHSLGFAQSGAPYGLREPVTTG